MSADPYAPAPELVELADRWATYLGASERTGKAIDPAAGLIDVGPVEVAVLRCSSCHEEIYPPDQTGRVGHLLRSHGYRMDGRQFDDQNRLIGDVRVR